MKRKSQGSMYYQHNLMMMKLMMKMTNLWLEKLSSIGVSIGSTKISCLIFNPNTKGLHYR